MEKVTHRDIETLVGMARRRSGEISLPSVCKSWEEAVRVEEGRTRLYYNDSAHSTRIVSLACPVCDGSGIDPDSEGHEGDCTACGGAK